MALIRSAVILPVSRPDFMGLYTITPMPRSAQWGSSSFSTSGEMME